MTRIAALALLPLLQAANAVYHFNHTTRVNVVVPVSLNQPGQGESHVPAHFGFSAHSHEVMRPFGSLTALVQYDAKSLCPHLPSNSRRALSSLLNDDHKDDNNPDDHKDDNNPDDHKEDDNNPDDHKDDNNPDDHKDDNNPDDHKDDNNPDDHKDDHKDDDNKNDQSIIDATHPFILLATLSRECSAVSQVRAGQQVGAAAVVLMEDTCRCDHTDCHDAACTSHDERIALMQNDGSAGDVTIPSYLLNYVSGQGLVQYLTQGDDKKNAAAAMELAWGLPDKTALQTHPKVYWNLWSTAFDDSYLDLETYQHFSTLATSLQEHVVFSPKFAVLDGQSLNCKAPAADQQAVACQGLCTNAGRYCAVSHGPNVTGAMIVEESLRRLCIEQHYSSTLVTTYFAYLLYHKEHCGYFHFNDTECIQKAMEAANVEPNIVDQCMQDSGLADDAPNHFLETQLAEQRKDGITRVPASSIGGVPHGSPNSWDTFGMLCRHFFTRNLTTTPDLCYQCITCPDVMGCVASGGKECKTSFEKPSGDGGSDSPSTGDTGGGGKKRGRGWARFFWFVFFVSLAAVGYYYYKKRQEDGMGGPLLNDYLQLNQGV